jgi:hypothetical protein
MYVSVPLACTHSSDGWMRKTRNVHSNVSQKGHLLYFGLSMQEAMGVAKVLHFVAQVACCIHGAAQID